MESHLERLSSLATISRHDRVCAIDGELIRTKARDAQLNERRREIHVLHQGDRDPLHRMLNAIQPGSYIRPHRHQTPPKAESLVLLGGSLGFIPFLDDGTPDVERFVWLDQVRGVVALDCRESVWHTFFALREDTVVFEVKAGPYEPSADKDFAPWSPEPGTPEAETYLKSLEAAFRKEFPDLA